MLDIFIRYECESDVSYVLYADLYLEQRYQKPVQNDSDGHMAVPLKAF